MVFAVQYSGIMPKANQYALAAPSRIAARRSLPRFYRSNANSAICAKAFPNKRPIVASRQGKLGRLILDTQAQDEAATTRQIVTALLAIGGHGESARRAVASRVRGNLAYLTNQETVVKLKMAARPNGASSEDVSVSRGKSNRRIKAAGLSVGSREGYARGQLGSCLSKRIAGSRMGSGFFFREHWRNPPDRSKIWRH